MALVPGTRVGPYEIAAQIGAGGMGEVYKARDNRLDRIVALKISKEEFTPRFETEARATAALEHPHICRLYDVCHEGDTSFLVMEYVEGTPLGGPLPLDRVLTYAGQIASALDEAHRKQIVHRDLKPSNVLVTPKGGVKLLDFGLAKLGSRDAPLDDAALTRGLTAAGTIIGTLHYMSPEQLQGGVADARSDIFAFGLVLYEMLTGKRAFDGASAASVIAAIIERPAPSVSTVAPSALDRLLQRCLVKDPDERWQSARDVKAALDLIVEPPITVSQTTARSARSVTLAPWLAGNALTIGLLALAVVYFRQTPPPVTAVRFQIPLPPEVRATAPIVSPDGRYVAFVGAGRTGASMVWVRALDTLESQPLPGTENAILTGNIFWSADSRAIAFVADNKLKSIEVASGRAVRTIADVPGGIGGGTWNADGVIVFSRFQSLSRLSAPGAAPTSLTTPAGNGDLYLSPVFLPDGRHLLYTLVSRGGAFARIATLEGTVVREYPIERGAGVVYADGHPAHLLSARGETLLGQPVDETTFEPLGESFVVADGLSLATAPGASPTLFSVASNGTLAYLTGDVFRPTQLTWFDRSGASLGMVGSEAVYNDLSLSPDDTRLAVTKRDANDDIWIVDLARNVPSPFTRDPAQDWHPVWSPDGKWLSFSSTRRLGGSTNSLFVKETINVGAERLVMESDANERVNDWSPDGKLLLVNRTQGRDGLWVVPVNPGTATAQAKVTEYLNSPSFSETRGQFYPVSDPKGRSWISYTSNESGAFEIYVESYPRGSQKEQISTKGGTQPRWRRDGKELYYISPDLKMMAVDVTPGDRLTFGQPKELFQTRISLGGTLAFRMLRYDVTRDGKRFLINSEREGFEPLSPLITVVLNWTAALKN